MKQICLKNTPFTVCSHKSILNSVLHKVLFGILLLSFNAASLSEQITVDGKLDEAVWQTARVFDKFIFTNPDTGELAKEKTQARFFSDESGLYIGFVNYQKMETRTRIYNRQDQLIRSDYNSIVVDFEDKGTSAFQFTVALGGGFGEGTYVNGNQFSNEWEGDWRFGVSEDEQAWYSEIFIPWNIALYVSGQDVTQKQIGIWFNRVHGKKGHYN